MMPAQLIDSLKRQYADLPEEERDRAVFGTMNRQGFMHGNKETAKGRAYDRKHKHDVQTEAMKKK